MFLFTLKELHSVFSSSFLLPCVPILCPASYFVIFKGTPKVACKDGLTCRTRYPNNPCVGLGRTFLIDFEVFVYVRVRTRISNSLIEFLTMIMLVFFWIYYLTRITHAQQMQGYLCVCFGYYIVGYS